MDTTRTQDHEFTWDHAMAEWDELRQKISALAEDKADDAADAWHSTVQGLQAQLKVAKDQLQTAKSNSPSAWEEMKDGMSSGLKELRDGYDRAKAELAGR